MSKTFRISGSSLRKGRLSLALVPLIAFGIVLYGSYKRPADVATSIIVGAIIVGIAIVISYKEYKSLTQTARVHSLIIDDEAMLCRDGDIERRVPYDSIEKIILRGMFNRVGTVSLKLRDLPEEEYYGYDEFPQLIRLLLKNAAHAKVQTRGLFMYNNAFKADVPKGTRS